MKETTTREVIERIQSYLDGCSQNAIGRYIGVTDVALAQVIEEDFTSILDSKVGRRLDSLLYLLECVKKDGTLAPSMLNRLLTIPSFKRKDGWLIDAATAIHEEAQKETLVEIFEKAIEQLRKPIDTKPIANSLYEAIHSGCAVIANR